MVYFQVSFKGSLPRLQGISVVRLTRQKVMSDARQCLAHDIALRFVEPNKPSYQISDLYETNRTDSPNCYCQDDINNFYINLNDFRSEPFINPLYHGFMSMEIWSSLWSWILSLINKVSIQSFIKSIIFSTLPSDTKKSLY